MRVLVLGEHDNAELKAPTLSAVTAARRLHDAGEVDVLVAGHAPAPVVAAAAAVEGVARVLVADDARFTHILAEDLAPLVANVAADYDAVVAAATTFGKNVCPRVAAALDVQQVSDVIEILDASTFKRPIYAGNAIATVRSRDAKKVLTVRATAFDAAPEGGAAPVETVDITLAGDAAGLSRFVDARLTQSARPDLADARVVVAGGRGVGSRDNFRLIEDLADRLGGAVGASRAAVDAGYIPNDHQVGQTGKIVAPDLYIAAGISGAIQHLAGMKDARVIVAINTDAEAPIFQVADYGLVADLFEALPELARALDQ